MKGLYLLSFLPLFMVQAADKAPKGQPRADLSPPGRTTKSRPAQVVRPVVYRPPRVGMPKVTVACGTRGEGAQRLQLALLAPEHTGWTTQESPVLWWHHSGPAPEVLEVTLVIAGRAEPVLQLLVDDCGNWHRLDLAHHGVRLQRGITYQWAVAAVVDPASRSKDLIASGSVARMDAPGDLAQRVQGMDARERLLAWARHGFWYDTISVLGQQLAAAPLDAELLRWGASLCEQAGLAPLDFQGMAARPVDKQR